MKAIFDKSELSADEKLMEATHYGMHRLCERPRGLGTAGLSHLPQC